MGKRIITQRRGRGTMGYRAPSHRYKGVIRHRAYDDMEKKEKVIGKVVELMHCPGHTAPMVVIRYDSGEDILISAPEKIRIGDVVESGNKAEARIGNTLPLGEIPEGTEIFNIEINPGDGGRLVRTAGTTARILSKLGDKVTIVLPSKKRKTLPKSCRATIGHVAGAGKKDKPFVKAGKKWHAMHAIGKLYPRTSGVAMNAVDHPFGSGRGRHVGKPKTPPRGAPPGRNIGLIRAKRTGKK